MYLCLSVVSETMTAGKGITRPEFEMENALCVQNIVIKKIPMLLFLKNTIVISTKSS